MAQHHLQTPFSEEVIRSLRVGDIVHFDGTLFGIRDLTQIYMFDQKHAPPVSLAGMPCIHTAPSLKRSAPTGSRSASGPRPAAGWTGSPRR